jgi:hypothetical protein
MVKVRVSVLNAVILMVSLELPPSIKAMLDKYGNSMSLPIGLRLEGKAYAIKAQKTTKTVTMAIKIIFLPEEVIKQNTAILFKRFMNHKYCFLVQDSLSNLTVVFDQTNGNLLQQLSGSRVFHL